MPDDGSEQHLPCQQNLLRMALQRCSFPERHNRRQDCRKHPNGRTVGYNFLGKHHDPSPQDPNYTSNTSKRTISYRLSIFEGKCVSHIRNALVKTHGSHVPSCFTANKKNSVKPFQRRVQRFFLDDSKTSSLDSNCSYRTTTTPDKNDCLSSPLAKYPFVRPIGTEEVLRRIICHINTQSTSQNLQELEETLPSLGQNSENGSYKHSLLKEFEKSSNEATLSLDEDNSFCLLNLKLAMKISKKVHRIALRNIQLLLETILSFCQ